MPDFKDSDAVISFTASDIRGLLVYVTGIKIEDIPDSLVDDASHLIQSKFDNLDVWNQMEQIIVDAGIVEEGEGRW